MKKLTLLLLVLFALSGSSFASGKGCVSSKCPAGKDKLPECVSCTPSKCAVTDKCVKNSCTKECHTKPSGKVKK
jgi:hypothetical protein